MASLCSRLTAGHVFGRGVAIGASRLHAASFEFLTALSMSSMATGLPTTDAANVATISPCPRYGCMTRATRKSQAFIPSPMEGGDASRSRTNCGRFCRVSIIVFPCENLAHPWRCIRQAKLVKFSSFAGCDCPARFVNGSGASLFPGLHRIRRRRSAQSRSLESVHGGSFC